MAVSSPGHFVEFEGANQSHDPTSESFLFVNLKFEDQTEVFYQVRKVYSATNRTFHHKRQDGDHFGLSRSHALSTRRQEPMCWAHSYPSCLILVADQQL